MAETLSVRAVLSATDKGFNSVMNHARQTVGRLGGMVRSGIGFGVFAGAGMAAFSALSNGARSLVSEIDSSNAAWKTFEGNMSYLGKSGKEIAKVKGQLQSFAQKTIYNSSDMASVYSQLEAVGVGSMKSLKNGTTGLVKGFVGLAASAIDSKQAMKTLSVQGAQMAGRPKVAWQDFKLVLDQAPAGIAAIAKEMGMTTQELVGAVQDGKVKTEDFFAAVEAAGNNDTFTKMATEPKKVSEAMDGLRETLANKLSPAFDVLSRAGISAVEGISSRLERLNEKGLAKKTTAALKAAKPYIDLAKKAFLALGSALKTVGSFLLDHSKAISRAIPIILALAAAYKAFKIVKSIVPAVAGFAKQISKLATGGISSLGGKLTNTSKGIKSVGNASKTSAADMLAGAKSFLMLAAGVFLIAAGFGILAYSAIKLADVGGVAIGVMAGLVGALVGLGIGMTVMLKALSKVGKKAIPAAGAIMMIGGAVILAAIGFSIMADAATSLAEAGGVAIGCFFGMVVALGGLIVLASALGPALSAGAIGLLAFGAMVLMVGAGLALASPFVKALTGLVRQLGETFVIVAGAIASAVTVILSAVGNLVSVIANAVSQIVSAIGNTLCNVMRTAGDVISQVVSSISTGFDTICTAVANVIDAISGGFVSVLEGVQGIIDSVGSSAKNAGEGFNLVAKGIVKISELSIGSIAKSLTAVATGVSSIARKGDGLINAGNGMRVLMNAIMAGTGATLTFSSALMMCGTAVASMTAALPTASAGIITMATAFATMLATCAALSALFIALAASIAAFGVAAAASTAGVIAFGTGMLTAVGGALAMAAALSGVSSKMKGIAGSAKAALNSFTTMQSAAVATGSSLKTLGSTAQSAMNRVVSALTLAASQAPSLGQRLGTGFTNGMRSGLAPAPAVASAAVNSVTSAFRSGYGAAYSAGAYIGQGLVNGLRSMLGAVRSIANQIAAEADRAIKARAKIGSPSKITTKYGRWFGEGFVIGMEDMARKTANAAKELVSFPALNRMSPATVFGGELSADYDYYRKAEFVIDVPLTVDGKEFARATASYTEDELNKRQSRGNRKRGKV